MDQDRKEFPADAQGDDLLGTSQAMSADEKDPLNAEPVLEEEPAHHEAEQFLCGTVTESLPPDALIPEAAEDSPMQEPLSLSVEDEQTFPQTLTLSMEECAEEVPSHSQNSPEPVIEQPVEFSIHEEPPVLEPETAPQDGSASAAEDFAEETFAAATTQFDPLTDAEQLPSLFPNEPEAQPYMPPSPQPAEPPTVVPRPKRKRRVWRVIGRILLSIFKWAFAIALAVAVLAAGLIGYLTVTEYTPAEREKAQSGNQQLSATYEGKTVLRLVTFNIGYGGLGEEADFFMDGGKGVTPESEEVVLKNMSGIKRILSDIDADVMFLQEVDTDSKRSYEKNQWRQYEFEFPEYETAFALNYSCDYVPYPIGDFMGKVNSGIATFSRYNIASATRIALPNSFTWPTRVANLKRCLLVTRLELAGREEQLVLVNCHLEAYDDGEAKQAQTELLLSFIEEEYSKGNYVIVGGDFNQTFPKSDAYPLMDKENWAPGKLSELQNGWRYAYDDSAPTCRLLDRPYEARNAQYYVIDGFILSPNVQLRRVETIDADFEYTDHNPVVLDISLK